MTPLDDDLPPEPARRNTRLGLDRGRAALALAFCFAVFLLQPGR